MSISSNKPADWLMHKISVLQDRIYVLQEYMSMKLEQGDLHAVRDSIADIEVLQSEINGLQYALNLIGEKN